MDSTNAERQARFRRRQKERIEELIDAAKRADTASRATATAEELERLRGENAELRERASDAEMAVQRLRRELAAAQTRSAKPKQTAEPTTPTEEVAALQRQLKAAQTRIRNLTVEKDAAWRDAKANPAVISKRDYNKLRKVFHPDLEAGVSDERKQVLTQAAQIFNRLKMQVT